MKKNNLFQVFLVLAVMITSVSFAQNYAFECDFDSAATDVFPFNVTNATGEYIDNDGDSTYLLTLLGDAAETLVKAANPYIWSGDVSVDAATYKYMIIKMKNNSDAVECKILFKSPDNANKLKFQLFPITANDADFKTYSFEITSDLYTGTISKYRLDCPKTVGVTTGSVEYAFVGMADAPYVDMPTAVDAISESASPLFITPSVATHNLQLRSEEALQEVRIISLSGCIVKTLQGAACQQSIDVLDLAEGVYLVNAIDINNKSITSRFIKK